MTEWGQQEQQPQPTLRARWTVLLIGELERIEEEFIMGGNRDKYNEELQDLNEKLAIIGLRLDSTPWQTGPPKRTL